MQGRMKNIPGPLAPPALSLPSRNMTDLSYSWTTFTEKKRDTGRVRRTSRRENTASSRAQNPGPDVSAEKKKELFEQF